MAKVMRARPARCAACMTSTTLWCAARASALMTTMGSGSSAGTAWPSARAIETTSRAPTARPLTSTSPPGVTATEISRGWICVGSPSPVGRLICRPEMRVKVVVSIRKMMMTSTTSISGIRLTSGCSCWTPRWKFIAGPSACPLAVHDLDQADGLLLHVEHEAVDERPEVAPEDRRRDRDDESEAGGVERDRDPLRELLRIGAARALRGEDVDHPDDGAEQAQQRADRRDGAQRGHVAAQVVRDGTARLLDGLLHDLSRAVDVAQARGEHAPERRMRRDAVGHARAGTVAGQVVEHLLEQVGRHDLGAAQGDGALDDERHGDDGREQQRPDRPAGCLDDRDHAYVLPIRKAATLAPASGHGKGAAVMPRRAGGASATS